jgi:hypothetical protein
MSKPLFVKLLAAAILALALPSAAFAQNEAMPQGPGSGSWGQEDYQPVDAGEQETEASDADERSDADMAATADSLPAADAETRAVAASRAGAKVPVARVFSAAEGVFGKGAAGLGEMIEKLLRDQGEPSAYITGREAGGAFVLGARYGSGILHHGVEGDRPVYWRGPSVGLDFGADANKVFVLVYNLYDAQRLFKRYPAAEGHAYAIGGFTASYLRRGDVVLIPIRLGVGARLGINAGYMRFSQKSRWLPF